MIWFSLNSMNLTASALGFLMVFITAGCYGFGPVLLKKALSTMDPITENVGRGWATMMKSPTWLAGFLITTAGGIPLIIGIDMLGLSIALPLTTISFIILAFFGSRFLGEHASKLHIVGILLLMAMPFVLFFSATSNINKGLFDGNTLVIFVIFCALIAVVMIVVYIIDRNTDMINTDTAWSIITGLASATGAIATQAVFGALMSGGFNLLDDAFILFESLVSGDKFIVAAAILTVISVVVNLLAIFICQIAYQRGDASKIYPRVQSISILISVTCGIVVFGQQVGIWGFYIIAIILTVSGTMILGKKAAAVATTEAAASPKEKPEEKTDHYDMEEPTGTSPSASF